VGIKPRIGIDYGIDSGIEAPCQLVQGITRSDVIQECARRAWGGNLAEH